MVSSTKEPTRNCHNTSMNIGMPSALESNRRRIVT
jgi:hypothetical protein